ncbi:MAG: response regulator [Magnetococcales bacterium]|nr:response regulator [Magnetococcales bacterium]
MTQELQARILQEVGIGVACHKIITDATGQAVDFEFIYANPGYESLTGFRAADLPGQKATAILSDSPLLHPPLLRTCAAIAADGGKRTIEIPWTRSGEKWLEVQITSPEKGLFTTLVTDCTPKKRLEAALKTESRFWNDVFNTIPGLFFMLRRGGPFVMWNHDLKMVLSATEEQMPALNFISLFADADQQRIAQLLDAVFEHGSGALEAALVARNGEKKPFHFSCHRIALLEIDYAIVSGFDLSERKRTERIISQAKEAAEAASRAKSEFLASMSHEIRTPMNAILGLAHLMAQTELTPEQRRYAVKIESSGRTLLGILNDILDFSKIEAGRMEVEHIDYCLTTVIEDLATIISGNAAAKDIEAMIIMDPSLPHWLKGDPSRLQQVLINLTGNAIKFTETGTVSVCIGQEKTSPPGIRFAIKDTGIGIGTDEIQRLFKPFSQVDSSDARRFGGTGLGLVICKRLVELMGGTIGVESTPGQGSTFWFRVPLEVGKPDDSLPLADSHGPMSVLVADDDEISRTSLTSIVKILGWNGTVVPSGPAAIEQLQQRPTACDVLLIDWRMPEMDGLETCRIIRSSGRTSKVPIIIMVTGHHREMVLSSADVGMVDAVLMKPVTPSTLYNTIIDIENRRCATMAVPTAPARKARLADLRVLVVEDNPINREVAKKILENDGARVEVVENGAEALDRLRHQAADFDVILMDAQMPILDGFEATRRIRHDLDLTDLPIIALSAGVFQSEREKCLNAGMNDFVAKPLDVDKLVYTILKHVGVSPPEMGQDHHSCPMVRMVASPLASLPGLDFHQALQRLGGDEKSLQRMLMQLSDHADDLIGDLHRFLDQGQIRLAAALLHKLRGGAGNLGLTRLAELCAMAEGTLLNGPMNPVAPLLDQLHTALGELQTALGTLAKLDQTTTTLPMEKERLEELMNLLADGNLEALPLYEFLSPALMAMIGPQPGADLKRAMDGLEFNQAWHIINQGLQQ